MLAVGNGSTVEITEETDDGWLRIYARPGDAGEQWLQKSGPRGSWNIAPASTADAVQLDFLLNMGLHLLFTSMEANAAIHQSVLEYTQNFCKSLKPLSLYGSQSEAIQATFEKIIERLSVELTDTAAGAVQ
jgi:hypothetical protein